MLFASVDLAARIERAERGMLLDCAASIAALPGRDVFVREMAGGAATFTGAGSPLNKLAGLGFAGLPDERELGEIEAEFARRRSPVQAEVSTLAEPALFPLLAGRGYVLQGFENVSGLELPAAFSAGAAPGIEIATSASDELPLWLDVVVSGFETPDTQGVPSHESPPRAALEGVMRDMVSARGFVRYLARRGGVPAGGASLRVGEGIALLCGAATLPAQRRHGVQSALLARRLADAAREGCDVAVVTTQPGSKSQQNVQRQGFGQLYTRAILVLPAPTSAT